MLTEQEILDRHKQSLQEAFDAAQWLATQQRADNAAPRGRRYAALRRALDELEGSCRQMAHWRGDARWLKLGTIYTRAMQLAQRKYIGQRWVDFGTMSQIFAKGLRSMDELATRPTGKSGIILPTMGTDWLILPDWQPHAGMTAVGRPH